MTFTYILTENDFLQNQLFVASKSKRVKKQRIKSWITVSLVFLVLSFLFYESGNTIMTYYFLGLGILAVCLYPFYLKWFYKRYYKKYIQEYYKNRFGVSARAKFTDNYIETFDISGESKMNLSEIKEIVETGDYFYLMLNSGGSFIITKMGIENRENVRKEFVNLADKLKIKFTSDLNWKWS